MNYKKMWEELKAKITYDLAFHESGAFQSIDESINCKIKCKEILKYMRELEVEVMGVEDSGKDDATDDIEEFKSKYCYTCQSCYGPDLDTTKFLLSCPYRHGLKGYIEEE